MYAQSGREERQTDRDNHLRVEEKRARQRQSLKSGREERETDRDNHFRVEKKRQTETIISFNVCSPLHSMYVHQFIQCMFILAGNTALAVHRTVGIGVKKWLQLLPVT